MSATPNPEWSSGRLENPLVAVKSTPTDCTGWESDLPAERWSMGRQDNVFQALPSVVVDCTAWDAPTAEPRLTVSVQFEDDELTESFVRAIQQADPTLRLERVPPAAVGLALQNQCALATLFGAFQGLQAAGCVIGSEHGAFRVRRKAP